MTLAAAGKIFPCKAEFFFSAWIAHVEVSYVHLTSVPPVRTPIIYRYPIVCYTGKSILHLRLHGGTSISLRSSGQFWMRVIPSSVCMSYAGRNSLPIRQFFILLGNPFSPHQHPHDCEEPIRFPWSACASVYSPFIVVLLPSLVCLIYLTYGPQYFLSTPHSKWWYGCITSESNAIALTGLVDKPVPTAFSKPDCDASQTGIWTPARFEIASFSCCFFRKYTFD